MDYIDDVVEAANSWDRRHTPKEMEPQPQAEPSQAAKVHIGTVEQFFSKVGVVAIKLEGELKVGDIIEIGDEADAVRQRVTSMQIDRKDVEQAQSGDSVGILLKYPVSPGRDVYKVG